MTIQAQPETIFSDLVEQIYEAFKVRDFNEFQLKLWDRDAERLLQVARGEGLETKAHLAALRGHQEECDRLYSAALRATDDYTSAAVRYLALLSKSLRQEKMLEAYQNLGAAFKGDPNSTRFVEALLAGEGFIVSAWELSEELSKMGTYSAAGPTAESERATQLISDEGYSDADCGAPVAFAKRFLASKKIDQHGVNVSPSVSDENFSSVFFQIRTDQSPEDAVQTELELFEALEEQSFPLEIQGKIVLGLIGTRVVLD